MSVAIALSAAVVLAATAHAAVDAQPPDPSPDQFAASGVHHAPRTATGTGTGYENNDGPRARGPVWTWRWNYWTHGLSPPPANGYAFPVDRPGIAWIKANTSENTMTWIGHATALMQIHAVDVLTSPMFPERASPLPFAGPKRHVPPGTALGELPHIDVVLISHSHYDHLDTASVQALNAQPGGPPLFLVPLGIKDWLAKTGIANAREMDWGDEAGADGLDFWFVPATHWSARSPTDRNETLWGGWVVKTPAGAARVLRGGHRLFRRFQTDRRGIRLLRSRADSHWRVCAALVDATSAR